MTKIKLTRGKYAIIDDEDMWLDNYKWYASKSGRNWYAARGCTHRLRMHRLIMGCIVKDGRMVDHINGDGLDNRRANLRITTPSKNGLNRHHKAKGATSKYIGVYFSPASWVAQITVGGKTTTLGNFRTEKEAHLVREKELQKILKGGD